MGYSQTEDPDTGAQKWVLNESPRTFVEVARIEGVSPQAVEQSLLARGITEDVINVAIGSAPVASVTDAELGLVAGEDGQSAEANAGMRVETSAAKATGAGLVEGSPKDQTLEQRRAELEANRILKLDPGRFDLTETTDLSPEMRAHAAQMNQDIIDRNARESMNLPEASAARGDWNDSNVAFDDLPLRLQADWVNEYGQQVELNGNNFTQDVWDALTDVQNSIERDYYAYIDSQKTRAAGATKQSVQGTDGRAQGAQGVTETRRVGANQPEGVDGAPGAVQTQTAQKPNEQGREAAGEAPRELTAAEQVKLNDLKAMKNALTGLLNCLTGR